MSFNIMSDESTTMRFIGVISSFISIIKFIVLIFIIIYFLKMLLVRVHYFTISLRSLKIFSSLINKQSNNILLLIMDFREA